ncbi:MAG: DoxX family protein [Saprospiraceae bacterium]|nr:DoxX family protein [Saprospiraceae bacterium]
MKDILDLVARVLISCIFLFEAYDSVAYYKNTKQTMIDYNLTWQTDILLIASIILLIVGGIFLLIGYRSALAATMLLMYWIPVTFIVYSFWNDPEEYRRLHSIFFMKNMAVVGGLLMIIVHGSGKYSVRRLIQAVRVPKERW